MLLIKVSPTLVDVSCDTEMEVNSISAFSCFQLLGIIQLTESTAADVEAVDGQMLPKRC